MTTDIANMPTAEQISAMPSGPEMDAAVVEVLGVDPTQPKSHWPWGGGYSTSRANAIWALEAWREQHPLWTGAVLLPLPGLPTYRVHLWSTVELRDDVLGEAPTLALAVCRALLAAGREVRDA